MSGIRHIRLIAAALVLSLGACGGAREGDSASAPDQAGPPEPVTLSSRPNAGPGEKLYIEKCAMCHGPGGMGTGLLARRVEQPLLEKRNDMTVDFVVQAARMGIGNMPAIPRGEASDEQLQQIGDYLTGKEGKAL